MANNYDRAFGFAPYGPVLRARYYAVGTAPTLYIMHQDIVGNVGTQILTPKYGYLPGIIIAAVIDGTDNLLGSVLGVFDYKMDPTLYIAPGTVGDGTIAGYVLVADHPDQVYYAREDFDSNAITTAEGSNNADIVSRTISEGNLKTGVSQQMIDSDTAATTAALNLKIYAAHPNDVLLVGDDTPGVSEYEGARYICKINEHYDNMTGVAGGASA
jgi:hypothetical protein